MRFYVYMFGVAIFEAKKNSILKECTCNLDNFIFIENYASSVAMKMKVGVKFWISSIMLCHEILDLFFM